MSPVLQLKFYFVLFVLFCSKHWSVPSTESVKLESKACPRQQPGLLPDQKVTHVASFPEPPSPWAQVPEGSIAG